MPHPVDNSYKLHSIPISKADYSAQEHMTKPPAFFLQPGICSEIVSIESNPDPIIPELEAQLIKRGEALQKFTTMASSKVICLGRAGNGMRRLNSTITPTW